jgi:hypothetical protein
VKKKSLPVNKSLSMWARFFKKEINDLLFILFYFFTEKIYKSTGGGGYMWYMECKLFLKSNPQHSNTMYRHN